MGLKYKLLTLIFEEDRRHLISDAQAEHAHHLPTRMLSARISFRRARSLHTSVPYAHAQHVLKICTFNAFDEHTRKKLMCMFRVRFSS